ncbi:MAG: YCF48-related protein [Deltaproteobacteria bacterium]|nr:YCF48-related protein [Deltaproteobacteria bacterium]
MTPDISRLSLAAALWCALIAPAAAKDKDAISLSDIRQNLFSACFSSPNDGWVVGELGRVFHTADRGKTFSRSDTGTRDAFLTVACLPDGTVFIAGQHGLAMRSTDQGKSWTKVDTGTKRDLLSVDFANAQVGVAVGDFGTMIRTEDGGLTWTKVALPHDLQLPEDVAEIVDPGDVLLYDIDFATPERGWAVGEFGVIFTTADGGKTWTTQQSGVETTLFGVNFADENTGFATGIEQVLLRTTDGGQTWKELRVTGHKGFVLGLYDVAIQGKIGWVVGDSGLILRTTDGGETWTPIDLPIRLVGNWFRGVALTPGADGIIVGSEGEILLTQGDQYHELEKPRS